MKETQITLLCKSLETEAASDETLRAALLSDPVAVLKERGATDLLQGCRIRVAEGRDRPLEIRVLTADELGDDDLDGVAGGMLISGY